MNTTLGKKKKKQANSTVLSMEIRIHELSCKVAIKYI